MFIYTYIYLFTFIVIFSNHKPEIFLQVSSTKLSRNHINILQSLTENRKEKTCHNSLYETSLVLKIKPEKKYVSFVGEVAYRGRNTEHSHRMKGDLRKQLNPVSTMVGGRDWGSAMLQR